MWLNGSTCSEAMSNLMKLSCAELLYVIAGCRQSRDPVSEGTALEVMVMGSSYTNH